MISEKKISNLFRNNPDYFETLFNNTVNNSFVLMDDKGVITAINRAFTQCFGYEPEDIVGKNAAILLL